MITLPAMSQPTKRSVTIDGHRTSVSLEDAFWKDLNLIADQHDLPLSALIARIDHGRPPEVGLATALRLFVLATMRKRPV